MFPFVSGPSDLRAALALVEQARAELRARGRAVPRGRAGRPEPRGPERGRSSPTCWRREVDFFSVGTNDLIQYLLAVDRTDPRVSRLYQPLHPAVLRTLDGIARAAEAARRPLSVCGEMAAQPLQAVLLVGLGFRELSMAPSAIPRVKEALSGRRREWPTRARSRWPRSAWACGTEAEIAGIRAVAEPRPWPAGPRDPRRRGRSGGARRLQ